MSSPHLPADTLYVDLAKYKFGCLFIRAPRQNFLPQRADDLHVELAKAFSKYSLVAGEVITGELDDPVFVYSDWMNILSLHRV